LKTLITRTITGLIFVSILVFGILFNAASFVVLFLLIEILALLEFYRLSRRYKASAQLIYGSLVGAFIFISGFLWYNLNVGFYLSLLIFPLIIFVFIWELYRNKKRPILNIASTILGLFYITVPFTLLNHIVYFSGEFNGKLLLGIFILMWASDSGAYIFGVSFGKNRLFERISPKKSWEGFIGGLFIALFAAYLMKEYFGVFENFEWYVISILIVIFGTLGDLVESMFKRSVDLKDSGNLLPGHGGLLDRFDSILLAIPVIFTYLYFFVK